MITAKLTKLSLAKIFCLSLASLVLVLVLQILNTQKVHAAYDGGRLVDNQVFLNAASMNASQIQSFLASKGGGIANRSFILDCDAAGQQAKQVYLSLGAPCGQTAPASHIIYYASQVYGLNPQTILATLQKEQSLVTAPNPTDRQYAQAMGYACPTSGSCDSSSNFFWQVDNGTWVLRFHYERARGNMNWWYTSSSWTCGTAKSLYTPNLYPGQNVNFFDTNGVHYRTHFIVTAATSALYCYTPHAYNNPQGLFGLPAYGSTGAYYTGSYNFVKFFELWFGSVHVDAYAAQPVWQSVFTDSSKTQSLGWNATLIKGRSAWAVVKMKNTGSITWTREGSIYNVMLGTVLGQDRQSAFCSGSWLYPCNRPVRLSEASVAPGETGTFEFPITAPQQPGNYSESFGLVINGIGYFPSSLTFNFTVDPERNLAQPVWQSVFTDSSKTQSLGWNATLIKGRSAWAVVKMKNTGNTAWTKNGGANDVMIGAVLPQDRQSAFCNTSAWLYACSRPVGLTENIVLPGETGTFEFPITAPQQPGNYSESFGLVVNGKGYFGNGYMTFNFTVNPEINAAQPVWQSVFTDSSKTQSLGWGATLSKGQTAYAVVAMKNTGNTTWTQLNGGNDVMLGTVLGQDRQSAFCSGSWLYPCNRPVRLSEASVAPGETGTFEFPITAPQQPGNYSESFGLVVNGKGYFGNGYMTFPMTISQ